MTDHPTKWRVVKTTEFCTINERAHDLYTVEAYRKHLRAQSRFPISGGRKTTVWLWDYRWYSIANFRSKREAIEYIDARKRVEKGREPVVVYETE